jgi:hypothetical protein
MLFSHASTESELILITEMEDHAMLPLYLARLRGSLTRSTRASQRHRPSLTACLLSAPLPEAARCQSEWQRSGHVGTAALHWFLKRDEFLQVQATPFLSSQLQGLP